LCGWNQDQNNLIKTMKKLLLILFLVTLDHLARAQGLIAFNNSGTGGKISTNTVPGSTASGLTISTASGSYFYGLFYSTTASTVNGSTEPIDPTAASVGSYVTSDSNWHYAGFGSSSLAVAGGVSGNSSLVIDGVTGGQVADFVVLGWSANIGSLLSQVEGWLAAPVQESSPVYIGESAVASLTLGNGSSIATPMALSETTIPGFLLGAAPIPEPCSLALGGLGVLMALVAARRKS
jgi:hypothetical protein